MKRIYIDPGHSNVDPGAVGYAVERDLNEKVSKFMNEHLLANYVCETKVDPVENNSLSAVANSANAWGADLFVSNHFNAGGGKGYEALVHNEDRIALGKVFEKHVLAIGQNSRGVKLRPNLAVLRLTNMPAVLNEGAFVDNWDDIKNWNDDAELKKLGIAYAEAAAEFLNLDSKVITPIKPVVQPVSKIIYRVRKSWTDAASQKGAFSNLDNAKVSCDVAGAGYYVFDESGKIVYPIVAASTSLSNGDVIKLVSDAKYTSGKSIPKWVINSKLYIREIQGDNIVFSTLKVGPITGVVNKRYVIQSGQTAKKSVTEIAKEVIQGKWGNGSARVEELKAAGYNPDEVQKKVNELL